MISTTKIEMDVSRNIGKFVPSIDVVQDDRYSRNIEITVLSNGTAASLIGKRALIRYVKADGTGGNYDALPDGTPAFTISGNVLTVALAPQVCTFPGIVKMAVAINDGETYLHTFPLDIKVHRNPGLEVVSENYLKMLGTVPDSGWPENMYLGTDKDGKVIARTGSSDCVSYAPQTLTSEQRAQARANIDALKIPRKTVRELFAFLESDDGFRPSGNLNVYKYNEMLDWLHSPEDFDFRIRFAVRINIGTIEEYEFTKSDCTIAPTDPGGRWRFSAATSQSAFTHVLTIANGISLAGSDYENSCSIAYPSEFEDFSIELYRIENTEQELKLVTSVNGIEADEYGNVQVPTGGSARVLLWSNPRPRYDFAAQSVPLDLSGYDGIEVLFHEYDDSSDNAIISSGYIPLDFEYSNYGQGTLTRGLWTRYRCFRIAPTGFEFETAYTFEDGNLAEDSWYIVPYRIYGFKY